MASGEDEDPRELEARLAAAEARAKEAEEWLDVVIEGSPAAICVISMFENRFLLVNRAMEELIGRPRAEFYAADPFRFVTKISHPDDIAADSQLFGELVQGLRREYELEKRFLHADGTIRWGRLRVSATRAPAADASQALPPLRLIVTQVIDITAERETIASLERRDEELRHAQRIDTIGRLAGGIAHDFNNLLTVMTGHGEMLREGMRHAQPQRDPDEGVEALDAILAASDRAAALTAQLLAQGRRQKPNPHTFVLSEAVAATQRLLVRVIGSNIETTQALDAKGSIHADQGQVGQVVMNLVMNARDAMPEGGKLTLATRDEDEWVALEVADSGHGMSPEVQARMFEPFFTTRQERPGTQGSGLGLATVQRIVSDAGGRMLVTSALGVGTTVTVYFPRVAAEPSAETMPARAPTEQVGGKHLLVVEDDPWVRSLVATVLVGSGYSVAAAKNGDEALSALDTETPFDLVVTDLMMPKIGGAELAQRLRANGSPLRVLFMSGYSEHAPPELAPYGRLLPKPFTPAQLLAAVRAALDET